MTNAAGYYLVIVAPTKADGATLDREIHQISKKSF